MDFLNQPLHKCFYLKPIEQTEIRDIIKGMDTTKSSDIFGIPPKMLKLSEPVISPLLTDIFNESFTSGVFPSTLKFAKILPIHKGGSKLSINNYRPISLLPIFSKILEKLMHERLLHFLEQNKIIFEHQFGFQKGKSTTLAIMDLYSKLINANEAKNTSCSIFLDFSKAFDTVNHDILLRKLEYYGIRGTQLEWFRSYLSLRPQKVDIGGVLSDQQIIQCGVPQGSILGPLLFILYINDIQMSSKLLKFHLFADDTCIHHSNANPITLEHEINKELVNVSSWLIANKLSLNVSKSNFIIFNSKKKKIDHSFNIKILNNSLEEKNSTKYLGVIIDKHLNWASHIHYTKQNISKGIGMIAKLRHYVPLTNLKQTYSAFIQSHTNYAILIWGFAAPTLINNIEIATKKAVRLMLFRERKEHSLPIFNELNILTFQNNFKLILSNFLQQVKNNLVPSCIQNLFTLKDLTNPNTRQDFSLPLARTNIMKQSIFFNGVKFWNNDVPEEIKKLPNTSNLKSRYKKYLGISQGFFI